VRVTARLSYGLGALADLAAAGRPVKGEVLAGRHGVSKGFLENILAELRHPRRQPAAGVAVDHRGHDERRGGDHARYGRGGT
jgi:hypothetical protein